MINLHSNVDILCELRYDIRNEIDQSMKGEFAMSMTFTPAVLNGDCWESVFTDSESTSHTYVEDDGEFLQRDNPSYVQHSDLTVCNNTAFAVADVINIQIVDYILPATPIELFQNRLIDGLAHASDRNDARLQCVIAELILVAKAGRERGATHVYAA